MTITTSNASETDVSASRYVRVPFWRLMDFALTGAEYLVYSCLLAHQNEDHQAFPSYDTMARLVHLSPSTVQRAIRSLEDKGLLRKQTRLVVKDFADGSLQQRYTSNLYTLLVPGSTPSARGRLNPTTNKRSLVKMTLPSVNLTKELDPVNSYKSTTTSTRRERDGASPKSVSLQAITPMSRQVLETKIVLSKDETMRLKETHSVRPYLAHERTFPSLDAPPTRPSKSDEKVQTPPQGPRHAWVPNALLTRLENALSECLRRPYHLKNRDVSAFDQLQQQGIPTDWIVENTSKVVEERPQTPIHGFTYIALVLEDWWKSRVRASSVKTVLPKPSPKKHKARQPERDARYDAFYALFPEASGPTASLPENTSGKDDRYANFYKLFPEEKTRRS
ncbi:helix-turn-helix domain-containing protein [Alicyclobacillus sp. SP_1]|uniref:helix-turn-helix domain-containing protein n=1 Tax=Alicyclobacillus sp. SP_1 TaxID=2942475 RepID=UPI0021589DBC|nr:helix-turn-helix domain-containing protein [Alicyclobacillus sp. SP_1]